MGINNGRPNQNERMYMVSPEWSGPNGDLMNTAYMDFSKNAIILKINPCENAKQVRKVILDGAKTYSEIFTGSTEQFKKAAEKRIEKLKYGRFDEYARQMEGYEKLKEKLKDPKQRDGINPRIIVKGFEEVFEHDQDESRTYFKKLVEEAKNDARYETRNTDAKRDTGLGSLFSKHYKEKFEKALKTYDALDYVSRKLEFHQNSYTLPLAKGLPDAPPAPTAKNTATKSYARKA